jgi:hypothetical protein
MARPQVADGGTASLYGGVTPNKLNKQSRTADNVWSFGVVVGRSANNSSAKCFARRRTLTDLWYVTSSRNIVLAQVRNRWWALVDAEMNLRVSQNAVLRTVVSTGQPWPHSMPVFHFRILTYKVTRKHEKLY